MGKRDKREGERGQFRAARARASGPRRWVVEEVLPSGEVRVVAQELLCRQAERRARALRRGEVDAAGRTILAKDRSPRGTPMRRREEP